MWAAAIAFSSTAAAAAQPPRAVRPALVAVDGRAVARGRRKVLVPGRFNEEQQAAHAATRAANARASGGHDAGGVRETLGHKYWCDVCSRGFDRAKQQAEHEAGKRHLAAVEASEGYWLEYRASAWFEPAETDEERLRTVVTGAWSLDAFVEGLPRRSRSRGSSSRPTQALGGGSTDGIIDPHVTLSALSPFKRARLWRYLRDLIPSHPALPEAVARLEASQPRFARVKELLESCEAFLLAERAALAAGAGEEDAARPIFDLACGHGLVGALLAYRFPRRPVLAVDIARRPAQAAWALALGEGGAPLPNLRFVHAGVASLAASMGEAGGEAGGALGGVAGLDRRALVLAIHGCNEVNRQAIEMARRADAAWLVLPCCLQVSEYVDTRVKLPDDVRYALLCGAMAAQFEAQLVESIDCRISKRAIVIFGGGGVGNR